MKTAKNKESPQQGVDRRAYRIREFNQAFGVCNSTTYKLIREGKLKTVVIGGRRLIPVEAAEALLREGAEA